MIRTGTRTNSLRRAALVSSVVARGLLVARPGPGVDAKAAHAGRGGSGLRPDPLRTRRSRWGVIVELGVLLETLPCSPRTAPWAGFGTNWCAGSTALVCQACRKGSLGPPSDPLQTWPRRGDT